ncbi:hypothetical protein [Numidum massiliense]|uniref:hypothetical protein n=1 Tax=Numidum massiliense TaxID=1522315 RepID=UPI0006D5657B|nr:hypothetical protein [Numidum massiliense]
MKAERQLCIICAMPIVATRKAAYCPRCGAEAERSERLTWKDWIAATLIMAVLVLVAGIDSLW